jgi:hypothetical protein
MPNAELINRIGLLERSFNLMNEPPQQPRVEANPKRAFANVDDKDAFESKGSKANKILLVSAIAMRLFS